MNTDVEDLLRQGMLRYTADLHAPAGLVREAQRRRGRRLAQQRSVTAGAALAACAAAVVAVVFAGLPGAQQKSPSPARTIDAAYLTKRVAGALSAAGPAEMAQMTVTSSRPGGGTATAREWSYGDQWRSVVYSSAGRPVLDEGGAASTYTLVDYPARTWARQRGVGQAAPAPPQADCKHAVAALSLLFGPAVGLSAGTSSVSVVQLLHTAVSCGTLTEAGRQRVDGIEATKLTSSSGSLISETIWVDPATYLPVRVVIRSAAGSPAVQRTADITWLKPTAQNQAALTVPIPAGFRQVPFGPVVLPASPPSTRP